MPKVAPSTSTTRRRSTRSPAPPSSSDLVRSAEMTAYQLLRSQLEKEEWRLLSNRNTGGFVLVKKGFTIDDAVEGESILIEEGFTLQKYEQLFFDTMEQDELEEWTDRLPHHPKLPPKTEKKQKNCVSNSPTSSSSLDDSDVDEEGYFVLGGGQKKGASSTKASTNKKKSTTQTNKKRKNRSENNDNEEEEDYESDGEDGMPGGKLRRFQKELFDTWLSGKDEFDIFNKKSSKSTKKKKSLKAIKAAVSDAKDVILENEYENEKMAQFKKQRVDPLVEKVELAVEEYAQEQKDALKKELMELYVLDDYPRKKEGGVEDGGGDEKENVGGKGVGGGGEDVAKKEIVEDEKADSKGAEDKPEEDSSDDDKVIEDGKDSNADWTSAVMEGSNGNGSN